MLLILGNGTSRLNYSDYIKNFKGEIWGCNLCFKEDIKFSLIASVHDFVLDEAIKYGYKGEFLTPKTFKRYKGYSTGMELINEAVLRGYKEIYLLGYDSINNGESCIYTGKVVIHNFKNQYEKLKKVHNLKETFVEKDLIKLEK